MLHLDEMRVLHKLNDERKKTGSISGKCLYGENTDIEKIAAICQELDKNGYFELFSLNANKIAGPVILSYKGMTYLRDQINAYISLVFSWIADHLIDILALIISIIALLNSQSGQV